MIKKIICFVSGAIFTISVSAQRNVMVIIADDLSPDYFGFYEDHQDTVDVPNLRSLVQKGIRFQHGYANPVCSATRATILSGRYGFRTGVGGIVGGTGGSNPIDTAEKSISKLLKLYNPNIAKAQIGKWHLSNASVQNLLNPNRLGYDHYEGPFIGTLNSYTNWTKCKNGVNSTVTNYATSENVDNAVSWLKAQNNKSFFLWLAFNAPHDPLHLPPAGFYTNTTLTGTAADIRTKPKEYFKAMIQAMDHEMGRLFDSLRAINRYDSTDFIFIGDNGNSPRTAQISDTSRTKGTLYEYGIHVPMIIAGPSVVNGGRMSNALVNTADIFATSLELMGHTNWKSQIPTNKPVDSKSILPIIQNTATQIRPWAFTEIFKLTTDSSDGKAMRNADYKLIKFDNGSVQLYNLTLDPNELQNLLNGTMSNTDIVNYNYLCSEMSTLLGSSTICSIITPIKLLSFTGQRVDKKTILKWSTAQEENSSHFDIERSNDAINFKKIGNQKSIGNATSKTDYSFADNAPSKGTNYYRLKQWDNDGKFSFTKVVSVVFNPSGNGFAIYPNPSKTFIQIQPIEALKASIHVALTNVQGQNVLEKCFSAGATNCLLNTSAIATGTYFLNIIENGIKQSFKVSINK